jgi:membrane-associated phospholipid phosphatase
MNGIYDLGIKVVTFLQSLGSWLLPSMQFFSQVGGIIFYMLIVPAIYWCVSTEAGLRVVLFMMLGEGFNDTLKVAFHAPRPYWYSSEVKVLSIEPTFGIPSGHAQRAVIVWSALATWVKRRWFWVLAIGMIFLISLSRMYLGVHFPTDILAGWLVGILLVGVFILVEWKLTAWFLHQALSIQILAALLASLSLLGLGTAVRAPLRSWHMPHEWEVNATRAGGETPDPLDPTGFIANAGGFFGMIAGAITLRRSGGLAAGKGTEFHIAARYLLGLAGTLILWFGLGMIFPQQADLLSYSLLYLRYALVGIWFTGLAPLVFIRLGLADHTPR